jgi:integrase
VRGLATVRRLTRASWCAGWRSVVGALYSWAGGASEDDGRRYRPQRAGRPPGAPEGRALDQLRADDRAVEWDLPDLCLFMAGTGVRIGEALAVLWDQVDFAAGCVEVTHTVVPVRGQGLLRKEAKSRAGERVLALPSSVVAMLRARFMVGVKLDQPVFPNTLGDFRDPSKPGAASVRFAAMARCRG